MIKFGTHQILSLQLFKALWHAYNTGKWYRRNYTTGNLQRYKGRDASHRKVLNRSQKLGPLVICFSHMKICDLHTFFFSAPLLFPFSPSPFLSSTFFLCPVNGWLLLTAQPLSLKPFCSPAKVFSDSWTPVCGLTVWENCISTQEQGSHTSQREKQGDWECLPIMLYSCGSLTGKQLLPLLTDNELTAWK